MVSGKYVSYLRVSTARQGASGLGLEAQRQAVASFLNGGKWQLIAEFVEIESGRKNDRPQLEDALRLCRLHDATLVVARLDRLSRNVYFLSGLAESGAKFVACDMPEANEMIVGILAVVAQAEARMISTRTKAALAAARARGVKLGKPAHLNASARRKGTAVSAVRRKAIARQRAADLSREMTEWRGRGVTSLRQIARELNGRGYPAPRGGEWSATQVQRLLLAG
jgi:DNA invertase Pin-like site-specific DNA recombinase